MGPALFFDIGMGHHVPMLMLRSAAFNLLFYLSTLMLMIVGLPTLIVGRSAILRLARLWSHVQLWLLDKICGLGVEFRGVENIPSGGCIVAAKHQSVWETFALLIFFDNFSYILKRELTFIPVFGWYLGRSGQIAINRSDRRNALTQASEGARKLLEQGGQVLIFPEGTRRPVDAPPVYRFGVARIYSECGVPCLPVALNSGLFWPRRSFVRRPGTVLVEFLAPIPPGLGKEEFFAQLQSRLEAATESLIAESIERDPQLVQALQPAESATTA
ncbi:MAG TPA: lysophospholipid acyltransferase family protein [Beijerinckiaceae bacterium]|nr:lysophospholipid acyltransferase family protein [Beijerinckiaceae bacterium]